MKVGVVSPYPISRKALCALLRSIPQVEVAFDAGSPLEQVATLQQIDGGVLLFDTVNPAADFELIVQTRKILPDLKILVLAAQVDEELELRAIKAGVRGCISQGADPQVLARALTTVGRGEIWVSQRIASRIIGEFVRWRDKESKGARSSELSRREWEIVALVAQGLRNKQVGDHLFICERTVKTHLYKIYKKLKISNRLEAILYYYHYFREDVAPAPQESITSQPEPPASEPPNASQAPSASPSDPGAFGQGWQTGAAGKPV